MTVYIKGWAPQPQPTLQNTCWHSDTLPNARQSNAYWAGKDTLGFILGSNIAR